MGGCALLVREFLVGTEHQLIAGNGDEEVVGLTMDSRKVLPGYVFVCLEGAVCDGHDFTKEAIQKGAIALVISRNDASYLETLRGIVGDGSTNSVTIIYTKDTRSVLASMSAIWFEHPARKLTTIGVTGTKGKTTTTYMIRSILENAGRRVGLIGTNEVIIGRKHLEAGNTTPESLMIHGYLREMVEAGLDTVVMEVSSQAIKQKRTEGILFDFGIFTNLSPDHIAPHEHKDFAEYLSCKRALFRQCRRGLVNGDDPYVKQVTEGCTCELETYGMREDCMLRAKDIRFEMPDGKIGVSFQVSGLMDFPAYLPMPGRFSVYNALAAISICRHFHVRETDIQRSLRATKVKGRIEAVEGPKGVAVLIDYAHNAMALASLLETLREYHPKRLICLFGCGGDRPAMRRRMMGQISGRLADLTVITDDNPRSEDPAAIREQIREGTMETGGECVVIPNRVEAIGYCMTHAKEGDIIVLAGKGHETYQEIRGKRYEMDERKIVREILTT